MRWIRWMWVCRFGRKCAYLEVEQLRGPFPPPPNYGLVVRWTCGGCGRVYERKITMEEIYEGEVEPSPR